MRTDAQRAAAEAVPVPRSRSGGPRQVPQRQEMFAALTLEGLRAYRRSLVDEESRASYWRRILQARLDVLRAGSAAPTHELDRGSLAPVLQDARVGAGRRGLVEVMPIDDIPPLPQLAELWERRVDPEDRDGVLRLEADLANAERRLSDYRNVLHRRLADATGELIARYREEPALCLSALPLPAPARRHLR